MKPLIFSLYGSRSLRATLLKETGYEDCNTHSRHIG